MTAKLGFTKEQVEQAYAGGASMADAAKVLGCSEEPLRKLMRAYGIRSKPRSRTDVPGVLRDSSWVALQVSSGRSDKSIAEELQVSIDAVGYWRRHHGIAPRAIGERARQAIRETFPGGRSGPLAANWKGGRRDTPSQAYIYVYAPGHPRARQNTVAEHILVMEKKIGRFLKEGEVVDHEDRNKKNNHPDNLILHASRADHVKSHFNARNEKLTLRAENEVLKARIAELEAQMTKEQQQ